MNDPAHLKSRHSELNSFRRRQTFARARSDSAIGAFAQSKAPPPSFAGPLAPSDRTNRPIEEEREMPSSPKSEDVGDSPCLPAARRSRTVPLPRRGLERTVSLFQ